MARAIRHGLLVLALASLTMMGGRALYRYLASPQTKIRWRLEEMVGGFNAMRARPVLDGVAADFVDQSAGITREDLHALLAWMFLNEIDEHGEFLWNAVFDPKETVIELAADKCSAKLDCRVRIFRRRGGTPQMDWDARIAGRFSLGEEGWQCSAVDSANHAERRAH